MAQELYELPEGWEWSDLGDHCQLENGDRGKNYPSRAAFIDSGIPVINAGNLTDDGIDISSLNYISRERYDLLGGGKVRERDLLFCLRGSLGKSAIVNGITEGAIASSLVIVRPNSTLGTEYLQAYFNSHLCASMIKKYDNGAAQPNLSSRSLKKFQIPLPPLNEQKRIVAKLDALFTRIDTAIIHLQQTLELSKALFASALDEVFEQAAQSFGTKPIEEIFTITSGDGLTQKQMIKDGSYNVYGGNGVTGRHNEFNRSGTNVVIGRVGAWCGNVRLVEGDIWVTDNAFFIKSYLADVFEPYLVLALQHLDLRKTANQAAQPVVSYKGMRNLLMPLPQLEEQERIVGHLDALSERTQVLETSTQEKISYLTALKASLLDTAFKGGL